MRTEMELLFVPNETKLVSKENTEQVWTFVRFRYSKAILRRDHDGMIYSIEKSELSEFSF